MDIKQLCDEYLETKWNDVTWSFSRINSFYICPDSWFDNYVLGNYGTNYLADVGGLVHRIVEDYYKYILAGGEGLSNDVIRDTLIKKFVLGIRKVSKYKKPMWYKTHENNIVNGLGTFTPNHNIINVEKEYLFEVDGYKFRGFIDQEEQYYTIDLKSKWSSEKYLHQQCLYMLGREYNDTPTKGFKIVEYKKDMGDVVSYSYNKVIIGDAVDWAVKGIQDIKSCLEKGEFNPTPKDDFFCKTLCTHKFCEHGVF